MKTSATNGVSLLAIGAILLITAFVTVAARPDDPKAKLRAASPKTSS